jgi:hypothetical protein
MLTSAFEHEPEPERAPTKETPRGVAALEEQKGKDFTLA